MNKATITTEVLKLIKFLSLVIVVGVSVLAVSWTAEALKLPNGVGFLMLIALLYWSTRDKL